MNESMMTRNSSTILLLWWILFLFSRRPRSEMSCVSSNEWREKEYELFNFSLSNIPLGTTSSSKTYNIWPMTIRVSALSLTTVVAR